MVAINMTFMPAHKDSKTPAGQLSFDRYPYLKHGSIAEPKLTFDEWLDVSVPIYGTRRETWLQAGFSLDHMKMIWNAAQENVPPQAPGTGA
jgi:hypothetical protein